FTLSLHDALPIYARQPGTPRIGRIAQRALRGSSAAPTASERRAATGAFGSGRVAGTVETGERNAASESAAPKRCRWPDFAPRTTAARRRPPRGRPGGRSE